MQTIVLQIDQPEIDITNLRRALHIKPEVELPSELAGLVSQSKQVAAPKALYRAAYIEDRSDGSITLDGIEFHSRILKTNLEKVHRVFPYIATSGIELHEWASQFNDLLLRFWADSIQEQYLRLIRNVLHDELTGKYEIKRISSMNPGSLADFPLTEQPALFSLLGDPKREVGVTLTESFLMVPIKTVSGIYFASEFDFTSCMLCPRENCIGRQSPFDPHLYAQRFKNA
jgi:hypothetical protein